MLHRRRARDYETLPDNSASMIRTAMIDNFTKGITPTKPSQPGGTTEGIITRKIRESDAL
jgi:hypothetical protein